MKLNDLIPDSNQSWVVKKNFLFFYKYNNIPACYIEDDIVFVFLDKKIKNQIIKLIKKLIKDKREFYLVTPELSNPKGIEDFNYENLYNYIRSLIDNDWVYGFKKIDFEITDNVVNYIKKYNCYDILKPIFDDINNILSKTYWDYYSNKKVYSHECDDYIRVEFSSVFRQIQLGVILS
jgi:hypothetical protein